MACRARSWAWSAVASAPAAPRLRAPGGPPRAVAAACRAPCALPAPAGGRRAPQRAQQRTSRRSSITCAAVRRPRCAWARAWPRTRPRRSCVPAAAVSDAERSMRRCASTNSSERWTSISVSLATASQSVERAPGAWPAPRPWSRVQRLGEALEGQVPGLLHHRLVGRARRCDVRQLLQFEQLAVEVPQRRVAAAPRARAAAPRRDAASRPRSTMPVRTSRAALSGAALRITPPWRRGEVGPLRPRDRLPGVARSRLPSSGEARWAACASPACARRQRARLPHRLLGGKPVVALAHGAHRLLLRLEEGLAAERPHLGERFAVVEAVHASGSEHPPPGGSPCLRAAVEAFVDLVERQPPAHQPVDRQAPAAVQRDVARQVARSARRCRCSCP